MSGSPKGKSTGRKGFTHPRVEKVDDDDGDRGEGKAPYVGRLNTVEACRREAARVYKRLNAGKMDSQHGRRQISNLVDICGMIQGGELAVRLAELERRHAARDDGADP